MLVAICLVMLESADNARLNYNAVTLQIADNAKARYTCKTDDRR